MKVGSCSRIRYEIDHKALQDVRKRACNDSCVISSALIPKSSRMSETQERKSTLVLQSNSSASAAKQDTNCSRRRPLKSDKAKAHEESRMKETKSYTQEATFVEGPVLYGPHTALMATQNSCATGQQPVWVADSLRAFLP